MTIYNFIDEVENDSFLSIDQEGVLDVMPGAKINFVVPGRELELTVDRVENGECPSGAPSFNIFCA